MDTFRAIDLIEGMERAETEEQVIEAWQYLIDTGAVWQLQGSYGRMARDLIEEGICHAPAHQPT